MIIPAGSVAQNQQLRSDVTIIGSGAAGIPLALSLADAGLDVILLEAGGTSPTADDQALYAGTVVDPTLHPPADRYRFRCLGGSTVAWGGRCVPFDEIDFEAREFVPYSGWPFSGKELDPYLAPAMEWLEAGECEFDGRKAFGRGLPPLIDGFDSTAFTQESLERFSRPTNLFQRYRRRLEVASNLRVIQGANCTGLHLDAAGHRVTRVSVTTNEGSHFDVAGETVVAAAGGIENARLLLASSDVQSVGIGNRHDVVGRYYMCHIAGNVGRLVVHGSTARVRHGYELSPDGIYCRRRIGLVREQQLRHRVNNVVFRLHFPRISDPAHRSGVLSSIFLMRPFISYEYGTRLRDGVPVTAGSLASHFGNVLLSPLETFRFASKWLRKRTLASRKFPSIILENKSNIFSLEVNAEQCPNPDSRVSLSAERDRLGMQKTVIDWRYSRQDIDSVSKTLALLQGALSQCGAGTLDFDADSLEAELLRFGAYGGHHVGTTRMGTDPRSSVVDPDCKVHDVANLYIAGSSVFPTSSQANPTLALTALALRLGEHLVSRSRVAVRAGGMTPARSVA